MITKQRVFSVYGVESIATARYREGGREEAVAFRACYGQQTKMLSDSRIIDEPRLHCYPEVMEIDYDQHVATFDTSSLELCKEAKKSGEILVEQVEALGNQFDYDGSVLTSEQNGPFLKILGNAL